MIVPLREGLDPGIGRGHVPGTEGEIDLVPETEGGLIPGTGNVPGLETDINRVPETDEEIAPAREIDITVDHETKVGGVIPMREADRDQGPKRGGGHGNEGLAPGIEDDDNMTTSRHYLHQKSLPMCILL